MSTKPIVVNVELSYVELSPCRIVGSGELSILSNCLVADCHRVELSGTVYCPVANGVRDGSSCVGPSDYLLTLF